VRQRSRESKMKTLTAASTLILSGLFHRYPHGQSFVLETAGMIIDWPIWSALSEQALREHMYDNAAMFLRLL
jgi:hypothetical protein